MKIPTKPSSTNKKPPLELTSIKMYSTGLKKVFTNHFYKTMNHNFGIEISIKNNSSSIQNMKIGGCVNDSNNKMVCKWISNKTINPHSSKPYYYYVEERTFNNMKPGKYTIIFWINDKKVKEQTFNITYK